MQVMVITLKIPTKITIAVCILLKRKLLSCYRKPPKTYHVNKTNFSFTSYFLVIMTLYKSELAEIISDLIRIKEKRFFT